MKICVVHLIRHGNPIESTIRFYESYITHPSGVDHKLLIVFKGFTNAAELTPYKDILKGLDYDEYAVSDEGLDITAYIKVIRNIDSDAYCFLNSHSEILSDNWLFKLHSALIKENIGLVGATGSYQSMLRDQLPIDSLYISDSTNQVALWIRVFLQLCCKFRLRSILCLLKRSIFFGLHFQSFPNPHIRTNAFMIRRCVLVKIKLPDVKTKKDAWIFESGRSGLTQSILKLGMEVLIVGKNGCSYEIKEWINSGIYKQANQENLLFADNQTETYQNGDQKLRELHSRYAWGINNTKKEDHAR